MSAVAESDSLVRRPDGLSWLRRELAPFPGRQTITFRMVVAVALVTIISMTLQTPETALSAYMVFFVTKENRVLTTLTGVLMILGITIAIAVSLFLSRFTYDYPELRIPVMMVTLFAAMYLSRVFVIGPLGFAIGVVIAITQTMSESAPNAEILVRAFLWLWVATIFPIILTVVINQILLPADPWHALVRALAQRLDAAASALERAIKEGVAGGQRDVALLDLATRGSVPLFTHLKIAEMHDEHLKERHSSLTSVITASERLAGAAVMLAMRTPQTLAENDRHCAQNLLAELAQLKTALREKNPILPITPAPSAPTLPELRELKLATDSLHQSLEWKAPADAKPAAAKPKKSLFVADALTNPAHARFALKVTLAAMTCYFIYSGLDWSGIHTAFITCCFIALENTGATMRKGWLRLGGCCIGGLLGFLSIMYLVPRMESIVSLVLLTAAVSALAGWVAAGSERISYAGLQIAFAFFMCLFQGFAPATDFDTIRDRLVGIVLGIVVSTVVFHYLWPDHALQRLRVVLAKALRHIASLLLVPATDAKIEEEQKSVADLRGEIGKELDSALKLSEHAAFEDSEELDREKLEIVERRAQVAYLISASLAGEVEREAWQGLDANGKNVDASLRSRIADHLRRTADSVEAGQPPAGTISEGEMEQFPAGDRSRLLRSLMRELP